MSLCVLSLLMLSSFSVIPFTLADSGMIGVNYGRIANNLPPPEKVVELLKSQGINRVKLYDTDSSVLAALANSGIKVVVSLPNEHLSAAAKDQSYTDAWVQDNVKKHTPATDIEAIAVGNEVFVDPGNTTAYLVPAMKNVRSSLAKFNLDESIKISSPLALSALANSYPPSAGSFKPDLIEPVIKPMLNFLRETSSHLMVNAYPFFAYAANADKISLEYALFKENAGNVDSGNGLKYENLLDAQIDAVFAAMSAVGFNDVKVVVTETGWPSAGDENEIGAGSANAAAYNGGLVKRVLTGNGTPLKPKEPLDVYLFALFNENQKTGPTSERNYGLFYPNENKVYDVPFSAKSAPVDDSKENVPVKSPSSTHVGQTWCVANGKTSKEKLQEGLDYACGEGGADCRPIQKGATCYDPESLEAHASYAFNSYYQKNARGAGTCDFGGAAYVVSQPPKYGKCEFPTGH
ncbi:O-Glycosyl hydrolases family 17 protein [Raphanus sativus]|uniref:glucan endo-1,3-beta-D-glucosidase n=1 Tax=Raphanus sativus TaxID=3726 RepID=A0A6J0MF64_RAPSA|nr:glucan endo-1,3-beta-glucosidase 13 [Raphanus sativus]KAJ4911285.1 O-Glycosyl hydrolases family 17 protein [Raphanus sativus]